MILKYIFRKLASMHDAACIRQILAISRDQTPINNNHSWMQERYLFGNHTTRCNIAAQFYCDLVASYKRNSSFSPTVWLQSNFLHVEEAKRHRFVQIASLSHWTHEFYRHSSHAYMQDIVLNTVELMRCAPSVRAVSLVVLWALFRIISITTLPRQRSASET